ncbi:MAG: PEP-CTERM sorting domain-containing protein [Phycisphaerae bacterium]|nr:PEP-CTERM sorting domain-containing protein [Phycisphaerae bacterium]
MMSTQKQTMVKFGLGLLAAYLIVPAAFADINLEYRVAANPWWVGDAVEVGLYAVSDNPGDYQSFSAIRTVFDWDPTYLDLLQLDQSGAVPLMSSAFPVADAWDLNEVVPPQDGDGLYQALANFGGPVEATPEGALITTFLFEALLPTPATPVNILIEGGDPMIDTAVIDGEVPGLNVTGTLTGATITIIPEPATLGLLAAAGLMRLTRRRGRD